jgi:hypothetical protein
LASRLQFLMKSRRSTSAISVFLGFVLTDVTVYPAAVPLFNRAQSSTPQSRHGTTEALFQICLITKPRQLQRHTRRYVLSKQLSPSLPIHHLKHGISRRLLLPVINCLRSKTIATRWPTNDSSSSTSVLRFLPFTLKRVSTSISITRSIGPTRC